jgi:hypothetical protein
LPGAGPVVELALRAAGESLLAAFRKRFGAIGGTMVAEVVFKPADNTDHATPNWA